MKEEPPSLRVVEKIIDLPFDEIASWFPPGLTAWIKRNPPDKAEKLLIEYRDFVKDMAREFALRRKRKERGF